MSEWHRVSSGLGAINPDERGFQYGDGVFETIAIRDGKPRLWSHHMRRLERACARVGFERPPLMEPYVDVALGSTRENPRHCLMKIIVSSGAGKRGYARPIPSRTETLVGVFPAPPINRPAYLKGVATILCDTRLAVGSPVAGVKTLNRIEQVLARSECAPTGAFEGLTLDAEGRLICGTMSNVFLVRDNAIATPALHRCGVEGVMRQFVMETCGNVEVCDLTLDDLAAADEVFITNSQIGAVPVHRCDELRWKVGSVTRRVMRELADNGIEECRT
jgi:4-amino-4-deoxychorismate lyase